MIMEEKPPTYLKILIKGKAKSKKILKRFLSELSDVFTKLTGEKSFNKGKDHIADAIRQKYIEKPIVDNVKADAEIKKLNAEANLYIAALEKTYEEIETQKQLTRKAMAEADLKDEQVRIAENLNKRLEEKDMDIFFTRSGNGIRIDIEDKRSDLPPSKVPIAELSPKT